MEVTNSPWGLTLGPMTAAPPAEKLFTVAEYHALGEAFFGDKRTELIRGVICERMISSPEHVYLVSSLEALVSGALRPGLLVRTESGLTLADSEIEPDIAVVTGWTRSEYRRHHPSTALLTMEVSITTEERDRAKLAVYAEAGIGEYWIILPGRGTVEVHREPQGGRYRRARVHRAGEMIVSEALPDLRVEVGALLADSDEE